MTRLSDEELRQQVLQHFWFHSIRLRPDIVTPGRKSPELLMAEEDALLGPVDLSGRSVLDVGAWNGYYSFAAERRGAASVLATDSYTWEHPSFRGLETLKLAAAEIGSGIETRFVDPMEITPEIGEFDVVMFFGVFYHLFDPIEVLQRLRAVTRHVLLMETHEDGREFGKPVMVFYPGASLAGDGTNWWGPNPQAVRHILAECGFGRVFYREPRDGVRGVFAVLTPEADTSILTGLDESWVDLDAPGVLDSLVIGR
ncbi:class I SAM-dependent methyltransferase [Roseococcus sp. YIM B11640]|uniref:class I SAM-dependent methyltransferase n=1 Tax=Roseococcus sp. YIM B11640 TaxID=3133973 RepID=UPI003C7A861C